MSRSAAAAQLLSRTGLLSVLDRLPLWRGVLVLNHHRIGDPGRSPLDRDLFSATAAGLEEQVGHLARHADVVPLSVAAEALDTRPGRRVALTFDDGYRDNHDVALPVLRRHGVPATFFLATGLLDSQDLSWWDEIAWCARTAQVERLPAWGDVVPALDLRGDQQRQEAARTLAATYKALPADRADALLAHVRARSQAPAYDGPPVWMTWDMARALRDAGMEVGGHTVDHPVLSRVDDARLERELVGCRDRLAEELGLPMEVFAYPVGRTDSFDARAVARLRELGVRVACTFSGGHARPGRTDPLRFPRASVTVDMSLADVRLRAALPQRAARW